MNLTTQEKKILSDLFIKHPTEIAGFMCIDKNGNPVVTDLNIGEDEFGVCFPQVYGSECEKKEFEIRFVFHTHAFTTDIAVNYYNQFFSYEDFRLIDNMPHCMIYQRDNNICVKCAIHTCGTKYVRKAESIDDQFDALMKILKEKEQICDGLNNKKQVNLCKNKLRLAFITENRTKHKVTQRFEALDDEMKRAGKLLIDGIVIGKKEKK